jgi:primary-amine oxidase
MDVNGTANTLQKVIIALVTKEYPWSNGPRTTMHLEREYVETEDGGKFDW